MVKVNRFTLLASSPSSAPIEMDDEEFIDANEEVYDINQMMSGRVQHV